MENNKNTVLYQKNINLQQIVITKKIKKIKKLTTAEKETKRCINQENIKPKYY